MTTRPAPHADTRAGALPRQWRTGADCASMPEFEVHEYNEDLYILRQSGCSHFEKPFLYLIFGNERALLLDTGAGIAAVERVVSGVISRWLARRQCDRIHLVVAHTHAHDDHTAGDAQFAARPDTTLVAAELSAVKSFFGIDSWPDQLTTYDLGHRIIDIVPAPGHHESCIVVYDRQTGVLLTGDTVYPGRLYVDEPHEFVCSIARLVAFTSDRVVTHVLGSHIENSRTPFVDYPRGTTDQPDEHVLELGRAHLLELHAVLNSHGAMKKRILRDFTIWPLEEPCVPSAPSPA